MRRMRRTVVERSWLLLGTILVPLPLQAATYHVAPAGSDAAAGTQDAPWATFAHAQQVAVAGDTVYFHDGRFALTSGTSACGSQTATISAIVLNKSGNATNRIMYWAAPGEHPIFDFSGVRDSCRITGIRVTGSFIHIRGLEIMGVPQNNNLNHESWGLWNSGSNNIFEQIDAHNNAGPGIFIADGGNNLVQNCDSHDNFDAMSSTGPGTNADGFGCHSPNSPGNVFRGNRAWFNGDDGYDFLQATQPILIEDSWAWNNGYLSGTTTASGGDGNGFKGGGFGSATSGPTTGPQHTVRNCVSFLNRASGFYANHEPVGNFWYNNTAFNNRGANFNMLGLNGTTVVNVGILRNNVAFTGTAISNGTGSMIDDASNSWTSGFGVTVSAADFLSTATTGWDAPRGADGSLPVLTSLHLAAGSDLIDKGANIGLPFTGTAPDLGAFEVGIVFDAGTVGGTGAGGAAGAGGSAGTGGAGTGGAVGTGGRPNRDAGTPGDASVGTGAGGAGGAGGSTGAGGASGTGSGGSNGGAAGSGTAGNGAGQGGGPSGTGAGGSIGAGGATSGGTATGGGTGNGSPAGAEGGCSCRMTSSSGARPAFALTMLVALAAMRRRRQRGRA